MKTLMTMFLICATASAHVGGSDRGGGDNRKISANLTTRNRAELVTKVTAAFSNEPVSPNSLRSFVANFLINRASNVSDQQTRHALKDMQQRGAAELIRSKVKFRIADICLDKNNVSRSATAVIAPNPPDNPEICINPSKIVDEEGPLVRDSVLIGLTTHELSHFYGYEDLGHELASHVTGFVASVYAAEDNTLVTLAPVAIHHLKQAKNETCGIKIDTGAIQSPCTPLEFVRSLGRNDHYSKKPFDLMVRRIIFSNMTQGSDWNGTQLMVHSSIDVPYSTGDEADQLRIEQARIVKIENPTTGVFGTITVEVEPSQPALDKYGHTWKDRESGEILNQEQQGKFEELEKKFFQRSARLNVQDLKENAAYKVVIQTAGQDIASGILTTPQYFIYYNVRKDVQPPIDFTTFKAQLDTEVGRQVRGYAVPFNEVKYRQQISEALLEYRKLCLTDYVCDGGDDNTVAPYLHGIKTSIHDINSGAKDAYYVEVGPGIAFAKAESIRDELTTKWNTLSAKDQDLSVAEKRKLLEALTTMIGAVQKVPDSGNEKYLNAYIRERKTLERELGRGARK